MLVSSRFDIFSTFTVRTQSLVEMSNTGRRDRDRSCVFGDHLSSEPEPDDFVCNTACWLPDFSFPGFCWLLFCWLLLACWASLIAAFVFVGTSSLPTSLLAPLICVAVGAVCLVCCFCMHITLGLLGLLGFFGHSEDDLPEWCDAWGGVGHAAGVCLLVTALPMLVTSTGWVTAGFHLLALCFVCVVGSFTGAFWSYD